MEKIKLISVSSDEYPEGRWDSFTLKPVEELIEPLVNLFRDLGFGKEALNDLDIYYPELGGFNAFYSKKIKAYVIGYGDEIEIVFDSNFPRSKIVTMVEKYFQFP